MFICVYAGTHAYACMKDRKQPIQPVLSFHHVDSGDGIQVTKLGSKLYQVFMDCQSPNHGMETYY